MVVKFTLVSSFDFVLVLFTYVVHVSILQQVRIAGSYKWGLSMRKARCCLLVLKTRDDLLSLGNYEIKSICKLWPFTVIIDHKYVIPLLLNTLFEAPT